MATTLGRYNPFRYRGYYRDAESGMYYLNARYYNPSWCRFISPDPVIDTSSALGCNLFAYSNNNPIGTVSAGLAESVFEKTTESIGGLAERIAYASVVLYNVPLYNQGKTNLCWAYCQVMVEDFKAGRVQSALAADSSAEKIAIKKHGPVNWDKGADDLKKTLTTVEINCQADILYLLKKHGPIYAGYKTETKGHLIVITGANLLTGQIYTNDPSGTSGVQSYNDFLDGMYGADPVGWEFEICYIPKLG